MQHGVTDLELPPPQEEAVKPLPLRGGEARLEAGRAHVVRHSTTPRAGRTVHNPAGYRPHTGGQQHSQTHPRAKPAGRDLERPPRGAGGS